MSIITSSALIYLHSIVDYFRLELSNIITIILQIKELISIITKFRSILSIAYTYLKQPNVKLLQQSVIYLPRPQTYIQWRNIKNVPKWLFILAIDTFQTNIKLPFEIERTLSKLMYFSRIRYTLFTRSSKKSTGMTTDL